MTARTGSRGRGYFGIGIWHPKHEINVGGLWRHAATFGASFVFTIGKRFKKESSDTSNTWKQIPMYHYLTYDDFLGNIPYSCPVVGVELPNDVFSWSTPTFSLNRYVHPRTAAYLLGAEDHGLPGWILGKLHQVVYLPTPNPWSMNVTATGTIVMYDRYTKGLTK